MGMRLALGLLSSFVVAAGCSGSKPGSGQGDLDSADSADTQIPPAKSDADGDGVMADEDCDDTDPDVNPSADEVCDGIDNDCNGYTDEDDPYLDRSTQSQYYFDQDGDNYGISDAIVVACAPPEGYGEFSGDCDDQDPTVTAGEWTYPDEDGDGLGVMGEMQIACSGALFPLDCNDSDETEPQVVDADSAGLTAGTLAFPWLTIQEGIDNADECVLVFGGTYTEAIDFGGKNLAVVGIEGAAATVIDATGLGTAAVTFDAGETSDAVLSGFTIRGGEGQLTTTSSSTSCGSGVTCTEYTSTYCGGAIYVSSASPTLTELILEDNALPEASTTSSGNDTYYVSSFGGGLCVLNGAVSLSDTTITGNYADVGGGLYLDEDSQLDVARAWLVANTATDGAAGAVDGGAMTVSNVASAWNEASGQGGGFYLESGLLIATQVTWGEDDAPSGGAVAAAGSAGLTVTNSIIYGADTGEGVLLSDGATLAISYSNVYGNAAGAVTGGTFTEGSDGNLATDPQFVDVSADGDASNDDWGLQSSSPSVDAGDPSTLDPDGSTADQGAFGGVWGAWD